MSLELARQDVVGLVKPSVDAHTLGLSSFQQLLRECGLRCVTATPAIHQAVGDPAAPDSIPKLENWMREQGVTVLGFSYRLDPAEGAALFAALVHRLQERRHFRDQGGSLHGLLFAGLPEACRRVAATVPRADAVFCGDESPSEVLKRLHLPQTRLGNAAQASLRYDEDRLAFGRDLVRAGDYLGDAPPATPAYPEFGGPGDSLVARLEDRRRRQETQPLVRAHVGPYLPNRKAALRLFDQWVRQLAHEGHLDVLSIGTSQLTQSDFGAEWNDRPNGGGVPINAPGEYAAIWQAARPMLVRTYAGTRDVPALAELYERHLHQAWHALSLWWFCCLDGRGPNGLRENLHQHVQTLAHAARSGVPFEPNIPHHFAFRGADDVTCIVSALLAAKLAKRSGIRTLVLQVMLNTPKVTWGVQDLAKTRALLQLVRTLETDTFRVILQPRGGLDYFSPDSEKAKAQLAAVTALMDDIEPADPFSPPLIHVVGYSEGVDLATPDIVRESVQITRRALDEYRRLRKRGLIDEMDRHPDVTRRTTELLADATVLWQALEQDIPNLYAAEGLYQAFARGYLPVPYLWANREEFPLAVSWKTRLVQGGVSLTDDQDLPLSMAQRLTRIHSR